MKASIKQFVKGMVFVIPFLIYTSTISAQEKVAYEKAKAEIQEQFGIFPSMFDAFPKDALPGAWETFKNLRSEHSKIPGKYRELIQLGVASQIPCSYCIYFHTASAKAFGATDEEIKEAIADGAETRHWSMIIQGNQIKLADFKAETDAMLKYIAMKSKK